MTAEFVTKAGAWLPEQVEHYDQKRPELGSRSIAEQAS
jgi:hypothetical protein